MAPQRWLPLFLAVAVATSSALHAQDVAPGWDPGRTKVTRADLQLMLQRLDQAANSTTYSKPVREVARSEAAMIRQRLADGDFQIGDRISLVVEGEQALTDTFTVSETRSLQLPVIGDVSLTGVLRSELEPHLQTHLAKFLREPVVHARSLIRLSVLGGVAKPGFYVMPSDAPLSDALMLAGGPATDAKITKVKIERSGETIWEKEALQQALADGRTLDQLNLRAGDQVMVPKVNPVFMTKVLPVLLAVPALIWTITEIVGNSQDNRDNRNNNP